MKTRFSLKSLIPVIHHHAHQFVKKDNFYRGSGSRAYC